MIGVLYGAAANEQRVTWVLKRLAAAAAAGCQRAPETGFEQQHQLDNLSTIWGRRDVRSSAAVAKLAKQLESRP